jgi:hypothetical protein
MNSSLSILVLLDYPHHFQNVRNFQLLPRVAQVMAVLVPVKIFRYSDKYNFSRGRASAKTGSAASHAVHFLEPVTKSYVVLY